MSEGNFVTWTGHGVYHGTALEPGGLKEVVLLFKKNHFVRLTYKMNVRKLTFIHVIEEAI